MIGRLYNSIKRVCVCVCGFTFMLDTSIVIARVCVHVLKYLKCDAYFWEADAALGLGRSRFQLPSERAAQNTINVQYRNSVLLKYYKNISNTLFTKF